jgi:hypothetical protein
MNPANVVNVLALIVALIAVISSSLLTWRALRLNENANHLPIVLELLKNRRMPDFTNKEIELWKELPNHSCDLGFTNLPEPLRGYAYEVGTYYQSLSYVAEYGIGDWDFIAVQTEWRLLHTWECIEGHVRGERTLRGREATFLNSYERFARRVRMADLDAAAERLYNRGKKANSF